MDGFYNLSIEAKGKNNYKLSTFTQDIEYRTKTNGFFIITDKSFYKASETGFIKYFKLKNIHSIKLI